METLAMYKFDQVKFRIVDYIRRRKLKIGDAIPTQKEIENDCACSQITVCRALKELEEAGIIQRSQGRPARLSRELGGIPVNGEILLLRIFHIYPEANMEELALKSLLEEHGFGIRWLSVTHPSEFVGALHPAPTGILVTGWLNREWLRILKASKIPFLVIGNNPYPGQATTVNYDYTQGTIQLYNELRQRGCHTIGLVAGQQAFLHNHDILESYLECIRTDGAVPLVCFNRNKDIGEMDTDALRGFLADHHELDAVIAADGEMTNLLMTLFDMRLDNRISLGVFATKRYLFAHPFQHIVAAVFEKSVFLEGASLFLEHLREQKTVPGQYNIKAYVINQNKE